MELRCEVHSLSDDVPLISVIVPIYNVEKYVRKCLNSLKNQTIKQIEVICINDGSTDASGKIADEYESDEWPRFRVIHHGENKGLSVARNRGINEARAEWIMFVDSDDWVENEFCRIPYNAALKNQADMVIFQADIIKKWKIIRSKQRDGLVGIVDEMTVHKYGGTTAWRKMYRKRLFNNIKYPEGRVAEDVATTHKVVHAAERILMLQECLYHYCPRRGSISHTHSKENKRDGLIGAIERKKDLISYGYPEEKLKDTLCGPTIGFLGSAVDYSDELYLKAIEIVKAVNGIPEDLTKKQKIAMKVWRIDRRLFWLMSRMAGR